MFRNMCSTFTLVSASFTLLCHRSTCIWLMNYSSISWTIESGMQVDMNPLSITERELFAPHVMYGDGHLVQCCIYPDPRYSTCSAEAITFKVVWITNYTLLVPCKILLEYKRQCISDECRAIFRCSVAERRVFI